MDQALDRYTRTGFHESLVSRISGPQDKSQARDTHPVPDYRLESLTSPGI